MTDLPDYLETLLSMNEEEKGNLYNRFVQGMSDDYGMHISNPPHPVEVVVIWATRLKQAWKSADEHPENPYADAEIEYSEDELKRAIKDWQKTWTC